MRIDAKSTKAEDTQDSRSKYETLTDWARDVGKIVTVPVARVFARLGFHANTVTILGFVLTVGVALLLAKGDLALGGWLLLLIVPIDAFDGALARLVGQKSAFGAFLDSTLDRLSEISLFSGLIIYYLSQGAFTELILAVVSMSGGVMVSYARARAEALGFCCKVGILTRLERAAVLLAGLILGYTEVALWVLAIGSWLTVLQRILHVYRQCRRAEMAQ